MSKPFTTRKKPRKYPEQPAQKAIVEYLERVLPHAIVHHVRNQGSKSGHLGMLEGVRMKELGLKAGFPDLVVVNWANVGVFFIEVKPPKGGSTSPAQKALHAKFEALGYPICVARSIDDVRDYMIKNGIGFSEKIQLRGHING